MSGLTELSQAEFETEVLGSSLPVLVDYFAPWCPPCRMLAPELEKLAVEFEGQVRIVKINVDGAKPLALQQGVQALPTLVLYAGGQEAERIVGAPSAPTLRQMLRATANLQA